MTSKEREQIAHTERLNILFAQKNVQASDFDYLSAYCLSAYDGMMDIYYRDTAPKEYQEVASETQGKLEKQDIKTLHDVLFKPWKLNSEEEKELDHFSNYYNGFKIEYLEQFSAEDINSRILSGRLGANKERPFWQKMAVLREEDRNHQHREARVAEKMKEFCNTHQEILLKPLTEIFPKNSHLLTTFRMKNMLIGAQLVIDTDEDDINKDDALHLFSHEIKTTFKNHGIAEHHIFDTKNTFLQDEARLLENQAKILAVQQKFVLKKRYQNSITALPVD